MIEITKHPHCRSDKFKLETRDELDKKVGGRKEYAEYGKRLTSDKYIETVGLVVKYLKRLDRVAYIRFASVYKQFEEPEDFKKLLNEVKK